MHSGNRIRGFASGNHIRGATREVLIEVDAHEPGAAFEFVGHRERVAVNLRSLPVTTVAYAFM